jgi:hypothetical protein
MIDVTAVRKGHHAQRVMDRETVHALVGLQSMGSKGHPHSMTPSQRGGKADWTHVVARIIDETRHSERQREKPDGQEDTIHSRGRLLPRVGRRRRVGNVPVFLQFHERERCKHSLELDRFSRLLEPGVPDDSAGPKVPSQRRSD